MSRLGRLAIDIGDIKCTNENGVFKAENSRGKLELKIPEGVKVEIADAKVSVIPEIEGKDGSRLQGLTRSLINNMIIGLKEGFEKRLEMIGVGYKANMKGKTLVLNLGYSHPIEMTVPEGLDIKVEELKITISGIDKQKVGQFAAEIREHRKPEPYKGKGIRYEDEYVRRKEGKRVTAT